jgi:hypothetical protein
MAISHYGAAQCCTISTARQVLAEGALLLCNTPACWLLSPHILSHNQHYSAAHRLLLQVPGAVNIAAIACGAFHNMALVADGRVLAWGTNDYGQLGNGSTIYSTTPVEVRV